MKVKNYGLVLVLLFLSMASGFAQDRTITGTVTSSEDGFPLPGATVIIKGTTRGQQTDFDGNYSIQAKTGDVLVFSYLGTKTQEITIASGTSVINVALEQDLETLQEVVIDSYRTVSKTKSAVAAQQITAETIENRPNASIVQTLTGQVAGLDISTASGQPGANSTVELRGVNSINGNTEPLFILDGVPINEDNFRSLNPNDIESVSVLKDAGATAIYGNRGANGVVVIKTKGGSNGALKINYTGIMSYATLQGDDYNLLDSQRYATLERNFGVGVGAGNPANGSIVDFGDSPLTDAQIAELPNTDWLNYFFRTALTQNHNLTFSGGGERISTFTSLGYFDQEGVLRASGLKRFNFRNNLSATSKNEKFTYGSNVTVNYSTSDIPDNIGNGAVNRNPLFGAYQALPYYTPEDYPGGAVLAQNFILAHAPLYIIDRLRTYTSETEEMKIVAGFNASYKITNDLIAKVNLGVDYQNAVFLRAEGPDSRNALRFAQTGNTTPGFQQQTTTREFAFNNTTSLNYTKTFDKHTVGAGAYLEYFKAHRRFFGYFARGLNPLTFFPGDGNGIVADNSQNDFFADTAQSDRTDAGLLSYFGTLDYDYDEKYGVSAVVRRDASYRFSTTNRWGTFYSIAGRWNISNEDFMQGSAINNLKLRVSYGRTGNQRITGNSYWSGANLPFTFFGTGQGYNGFNSILLSQLGNDTLKWETVEQTNIGVDFGVWRNRLRGSLDVYSKTTLDLFQDRPISGLTGQFNINANIGDLSNKGVDLQLHYDLVRNQDFNVTLNFVGNYNKNELLSVPNETGEIPSLGRIGGPLGELFLVRYAGVNPATGNLLFLDADGNLTENPNVDTDRVWLDKNSTPDAQGSFGFDIDYKGFFLTTQFNYAIGIDRFDFDYADFIDRDNIGDFNLSADILNAWTIDNRETDIPSLNATNLNLDNTDRFVREADYLRLRFASIGYSFSKKHLENTGISNLRVFANAENLVTFTKFRGFDPSARAGQRTYPTPKIISFGIELGL